VISVFDMYLKNYLAGIVMEIVELSNPSPFQETV